MNLKKVAVKNLFDYYSYEIPFIQGNPITIIHAPNVTNILALCFCDKESGGLGYGRQKKSLDKEKIESSLRLAYDFECFFSTLLYNEIQKWQIKNNIQILIKNLQVA